MDDLCPIDGIEGTATGQKGAVGDGQFHIPFLDTHDGKADDTTGEGGEEEGEENALPTDEGPHHRQEFHVASSHARLAGDPLVGPGHQPQTSPPGDNAQGGLLPGDGGHKKGEEKEEGNPRKGDGIGDDAVVDVDEGKGDKGRKKEEVGQGTRCGTEGVEGREGKSTGEGFDGRVSTRDPALAVTTAAL